MKKSTKILLIVIGVIIALGIIGSFLPDTESPAEPTNQTNQIEPESEYDETRNYIWEFLLAKGYKVDTVLGVPNIGKKEIDLGKGYEGWYAIMKDGKEYSVILYNGEVTGIQPVK